MAWRYPGNGCPGNLNERHFILLLGILSSYVPGHYSTIAVWRRVLIAGDALFFCEQLQIHRSQNLWIKLSRYAFPKWAVWMEPFKFDFIFSLSLYSYQHFQILFRIISSKKNLAFIWIQAFFNFIIKVM
jgi:hypothetical protein